jgi:hypothetical protein
MKPSTTDQIKGKLREMKGKAKEKAGQVTSNPNLADGDELQKPFAHARGSVFSKLAATMREGFTPTSLR